MPPLDGRRTEPHNVVCRAFRGLLLHAREKGIRLFGKTAGILCMGKWTEAALRHWTGLYGFGASFRRPAFSTVQDVSKVIQDSN